ncbi:sterol desaturase family protein [Dinoroseobacter sp. S124A]|uniref:sterol desaturase family protein n=1 Tax=Dinoroseobacter sp. S124A TaxID=3415128 RepID=UPI003C7CA842
MDLVYAYIRDLLAAPFNMNLRISLVYLGCTLCLAASIWLWRGRPGGFLAWLLPAKVYRHRSNLLDIKLFFTNRLVDVSGLAGALFFPPLVASGVLSLWADFAGYAPPPESWLRVLAATVIIVMASDFCKYWAHRWHHEWPILWPFHAVHHSAEVLTPLTVMRAHPVETLLRNLLMTLIVGLVQAVVLIVLLGRIDIVTIGGANALYVVFNALGANLRHSHIWLSYGRVMEHVFISPAQHQIHHSMAVEHHDRNYGSIFALWDWAFGTLYIPERQEDLTFGISEADGTPIPQPHRTLGAALVGPFRNSFAVLREKSPEASRQALDP